MALVGLAIAGTLLLSPATPDTTDSKQYYEYEKNDTTYVDERVEMEGAEVTATRLSVSEEVGNNIFGQNFAQKASQNARVSTTSGVGQEISHDVPGQTLAYKDVFLQYLNHSATFGLQNTDPNTATRTLHTNTLLTPSLDLSTKIEPYHLENHELDIGLFGQSAATKLNINDVNIQIGAKRYGEIRRLKGLLDELESTDKGWRKYTHITREGKTGLTAAFDIGKKQAEFEQLFNTDYFYGEEQNKSFYAKIQRNIHDTDVQLSANLQRGRGYEENSTEERHSEKTRRINSNAAALNLEKNNVKANVMLERLIRTAGSLGEENNVRKHTWHAIASYNKELENTTIQSQIGIQNNNLNTQLAVLHNIGLWNLGGGTMKFTDQRSPYVFDTQIYKNIREGLQSEHFHAEAYVERKSNPGFFIEARYINSNRYTKTGEISKTNIEGITLRKAIQAETQLLGGFLNAQGTVAKRFLKETGRYFPNGAVPQSPPFEVGMNINYVVGLNDIHVSAQYRNKNRFVHHNIEKRVGNELYINAGFARRIHDSISVYANIQNIGYSMLKNTVGVTVKNRQESNKAQISELDRIRGFPAGEIGITIKL